MSFGSPERQGRARGVPAARRSAQPDPSGRSSSTLPTQRPGQAQAPGFTLQPLPVQAFPAPGCEYWDFTCLGLGFLKPPSSLIYSRASFYPTWKWARLHQVVAGGGAGDVSHVVFEERGRKQINDLSAFERVQKRRKKALCFCGRSSSSSFGRLWVSYESDH